ncbi:MAG: creatininase family protein [Pseudomonadota bacterium]
MRFWQDLTSDEFKTLDPDRTVALLPVGAIEQHGEHLPLSTDSAIAEAICHGAAKLVPDSIPLLVLPTQHIGKSTEHIEYEGTLTHTATTLQNSWMEIGQSVARAGVRKLVFFNAHGGQPQVMEICCRELRVQEKMLAVGCSGWSFGSPDADVPDDERRYGVHAGQVETAIMLHLRPDLVKMDKAQNFSGLLAKVESEFTRLRVLGSTYMGWVANDLHPLGCSGDATLATAELGKIFIDHYVAEMAAMLEEVSAYPLSNLKDRDEW